MSNTIEVEVVERNKFKVTIPLEEVIELSNKNKVDVLSNFQKQAEQYVLREIAAKYDDSIVNHDFIIVNDDKMYIKDKGWNYHNNHPEDVFVTTLSSVDLLHIEEMNSNIFQAKKLLCRE